MTQEESESKAGSGSGSGSGSEPENLTGVIDQLEQGSEGSDSVRVEDAMEAFESRLFGPMLVLPGLVLLTPLGGVPLAPAILGVMVAIIAGQRLVGLKSPWVPKWVRQRGVNREKAVKAFKKVRPLTRWVDKLLKPRLTVLTEGPAEIGAALLALLLGASIPVVGLVPLAAMAPGAGLVLIGVALIARDGVVMIGAWLASALVGYLVFLALF